MTESDVYTPPEVWTWDAESGGKFANINRPIAGPTHDKELPRGKHPLQLHSLATPNGVKVTILLEELLALGKEEAEYDAYLINIGNGDQFGSGFVDINPNSKIPALLDTSTTPETRVFESGAILIYLAEKCGAFIPTDPAARAECLSWLMWQMGGQGPMFGQVNWFLGNQPDNQGAIERYINESVRLLGVLDRKLAEAEYVAGDYSIADIAIYSWHAGRIQDWMPEQRSGQLEAFANVSRWQAACAARPGVAKGMTVPS